MVGCSAMSNVAIYEHAYYDRRRRQITFKRIRDARSRGVRIELDCIVLNCTDVVWPNFCVANLGATQA